MRIIERFACAGLLAGLIGGCDDASSGGQPHQTAREAMTLWAKAPTPKAVCAQLSYGFALFLTDGDVRGCETRISKRITVGAQPVKILSVAHRHGQDVVRAGLGDQAPTDYYFVKRDDVLKLNSIGIDMGPDTPAGPQDDPPRPPG